MNCPICGELMDETIDDGSGDFGDKIVTIYRCEDCDVEKYGVWVTLDADASEYPVIAPALAGSEALAKDTTFAEPPANMSAWEEMIDERDALKAANARLRAALEMLISEADKVADSIEVSLPYDVRVLKEICFNAAQALNADDTDDDDGDDIPF